MDAATGDPDPVASVKVVGSLGSGDGFCCPYVVGNGDDAVDVDTTSYGKVDDAVPSDGS